MSDEGEKIGLLNSKVFGLEATSKTFLQVGISTKGEKFSNLANPNYIRNGLNGITSNSS